MRSEEIFPNNLRLEDFDYNLPENKIAILPNENREQSKLLFFDANSNKMVHSKFNNITDFLPDNSLLVLNSSKVIPARFAMKKQTGGIVELLCVEPILPSTDPQISIAACATTTWECIVGGRKIYEGAKLVPLNPDIKLEANIKQRYENKAIVEFVWEPEDYNFATILNILGKIPLPPYIKREVMQIDNSRYQTIYADNQGSVAAPTAGLHFSGSLIEKIKQKGINTTKIILHVGPGTFVPIGTDIHLHQMHNEQIFIQKNIIKQLVENYSKKNNFTIATGTTTLRTLETIYWLGVKLIRKDIKTKDLCSVTGGFIEQNYPYIRKTDIDVEKAFNEVFEFLEQNKLDVLHCRTQLFIVPSYKIRTTNALITNFHLPKSSLLLLVSAFIGTENCKNIYDSALDNDYKFLSYGDASLLITAN